MPPLLSVCNPVLPATLNDDGVDVQREHSFVITLSAVTLSLRTALLAMSLSAPLGPTVQSVDGAREGSLAPDEAHRVSMGVEGEEGARADRCGGRRVVGEARDPAAHRCARPAELAGDLS